MKYNKLINESPAISEIGLGTWQLGVKSGWKEMAEKDGEQVNQDWVKL
jgi:aryl-alcohol dehydrogenase-like predicted oxidoreductase